MKNQHGMMMMPMPMPFGPPPMTPQADHPLDRVPTRVFVAIKFLGDVTDYTREVIAVASSDANTEIQNFRNQELGLSHFQARDAACDLLSRYFSGQWKPEKWEEPKADAPPKASIMLQCFACAGQGNIRSQQCEVCKGTRNVLVIPTDPDGRG